VSNEFSRPTVTLADVDGNLVCVELENGKYSLQTKDQASFGLLVEIRDLLRDILTRLERND
jgi:hypothetical protein